MELRVYWRRQTKTNLINKYSMCRHMCYEKKLNPGKDMRRDVGWQAAVV